MIRMTLKDAPVGSIVFLRDRMGDEVRETFYLREEGRPVRYDYDVPVAAYGCVQGEPGQWPRVIKLSKEPCRDPGEADGRVTVYPIFVSIWAAEHLGIGVASPMTEPSEPADSAVK